MKSGVRSADYDPPARWCRFYVALHEPGRGGKETERTIGGLTDAELQWVARVVLAESVARSAAKRARKESLVNAG